MNNILVIALAGIVWLFLLFCLVLALVFFGKRGVAVNAKTAKVQHAEALMAWADDGGKSDQS